MTNQDDKAREAFEAEARGIGFSDELERDTDGDYIDWDIAAAWQMTQAALKAARATTSYVPQVHNTFNKGTELNLSAPVKYTDGSDSREYEGIQGSIASEGVSSPTPYSRDRRAENATGAQELAAERTPAQPGVDHRKIGCLIHDNLDEARKKHENVIAIYDALKPYLAKDCSHDS